ncbi:MAG TPA: putative lipid II flippase FtsW [Gaiellales bacterium]|nr:putative lipid II flippase FtsW [Gaiellales bacterium]
MPPETPPRPRRRRPAKPVYVEYHILLLLTLGLVAFGLIMVYSASSGTAVVQGQDPLGPLVRQGSYALAGIACMAAAARIPYRKLRLAVPFLLLAALAGLALVRVPGVGLRLNGAARWIAVGPITLQPSEFAKLAMVVFVAAVLTARKRPPHTVKELANPVGLVALVVCGLVALEPDLGTTIAIAVMITGVLIVAGTPFRLLVGTFAVLGTGAGLVISQNSYMHARLLAFLHPFHDAGGSGYQNAQALIALGSGGLWGKGLGQGTQKVFYLPESPSDMIAAVIGEELGLIGIVLTAAAFAGFAFLGFRIALRCHDPFGKYLAAGATCLVTGQAVVNLGAVLGFLPLTGVPLPLISSGGSSLVVFLTLTGVLLNVAQAERRPVRATAAKPDAVPDSRPRSRPAPAGADRRRRHRRPRRAVAGGRRRAHG